MKCTSFCVLASVSAFVSAAAVRAQAGSEYGNAAPLSDPSSWAAGAPAVGQAKPKPRPAIRPAMFAPVAAANAKRMSAQQRQERRFLKDAAAGSRFETEASRMALAKSSDPGVRSFAATLINYHASASNDLLYMLQVRGMAPPMLANGQRKALNRLAKLQGAKFDRAFLEEVALRYQQEDVEYYEKASLIAREPRLKAWIDRTLPTLRYHLAAAERIAPADTRLAIRAAGVPQSTAGNRFVSRAGVSTRSMGAGPAPADAMQLGGMGFGGMQFGGAAQLGVVRPIAARPNESNTR